MKKILFLASGTGSNFSASIEYIQKIKLDVEILGLICNKKEAKVLEKAKNFGIKIFLIESKENPNYDLELKNLVMKLNPDLIVLAGYMKILSGEFIFGIKNKIINIHPSLLPSFQGIKSIEKAFDYGVKFTGCTVHFVEEEIDSGAIILQSVVEILPKMNITELTEIIHQEEHKILPLAIEYFCKDRLLIEGRKVSIIHD